jgi:glycosyltransferase involved in cell wall biosynthesis
VGGVPEYVAALVEGLRERLWTVTVAAPDSVASGRVRDAGATLVPLRLAREPRPVADARAVRQLVELCRTSHVSVIHGHSSKAGVLAGLAGRIAGVPSVYTPHAWSFEMPVPLPVRGVYAAVESTLVHRFHRRVIAVANAERDAAVRWRVAPAAAVDVVPTGLRANPSRPARAFAREALGLPPDAIVAAWVGRSSALKRPQDLAPLARRLAGHALVVALGTGLAEAPAAAALRAAGGVVAPSEASAELLYAAADVLVQTSGSEGLPLVVLEAMRAGLPVVAYRVGGVPELVEDGRTGYLAPPADVDELARLARDLAGDAALRSALGEAGRRRFEERFAFNTMLGSIERIYRAAAVAGRRTRKEQP